MDVDPESPGEIEADLGTEPGSWTRTKKVLSEPGGSLLLLRAFLGVTFTFAGLQKLANANFFRANAPGSFDEQLHGGDRHEPAP